VTRRYGRRVENAVVKVSRMLEEEGSKNRVGHRQGDGQHVVGADAQTPSTERRKVRARAGMCFQRRRSHCSLAEVLYLNFDAWIEPLLSIDIKLSMQNYSLSSSSLAAK
jgi:hypothetical protein